MPSTINRPAVPNSFLGLQSYTEAQSNSFFGRDGETEALTNLIGLNTLTIVFGRSGTGKTSLLNAGVFPRLRKRFCLPFRIRLEFNDNSPDLVTQVKKVLKEEIDKYGFKVESYPSNETLWEYFHKEPLWKTVTPILVFDQFEEIFTLARSNFRFAAAELPGFWQELSDLIENNIPEKLKSKFLEQKDEVEYNYKKQKAKIVFSFREEYLPEFESITSRIPSLKYSRFRLLPMNGNQAYEVITKTWKENIHPSEAKLIVSYFTNEQALDDYDLITVEPSLLSQVCAYIDKERIDNGAGKVSAELLDKYPKEAILRSIYEEAVRDANNSLKKNEGDARNYVKEFVEEKLITTEGYRTRYQLGAKDEGLKPGINVLVIKYFVREDDNVVELTHDVVAPLIKNDREKRRTKEAQSKARKKAIRIAAFIVMIALAGGLALALVGYFKKLQMESLRDKAKGERDAAIALKDQTNLELKDIQNELNFKRDSLRRILNNPSPVTATDKVKNVQALLDELNQLSRAFAELGLKTEGDISAFVLKNRNSPNVTVPPIKPAVQQNDKVDSLQRLLNTKDRQYDSLLAAHQSLTKRFNDLRKEFDRLNGLYNDLMKKYYETPKQNTGNNPNNKPVANSFDTTNSLKLDLYYGKKYNTKLNPPSNLTIYLIPYQHNAGIIKKAKVYEINCDETALKNASGYKIALYNNGNYYFQNVAQGKYFIKICTYYGGFYNYTKRSTGMETLSWDASPPIR